MQAVVAFQTAIVPEVLADAPGYDLCGIYHLSERAGELACAFYDFYANGSGRYGLLIGDVLGVEGKAAAGTAQLRYSTRALAAAGMGPAQILNTLNGLSETQGVQFETATLFVGILDVWSSQLLYANAGHEPPMLKRADGQEEVLASTGPPLGLQGALLYGERKSSIGPLDSLLLVTDGLTEARDEDGFFLTEEEVWKLFVCRLTLRPHEILLNGSRQASQNISAPANMTT